MERYKLPAKIALAIALPGLAYWSSLKIPIMATGVTAALNNFLWIGSFAYFALYLPIRGMGISRRNWPFKVIAAIAGFALVLSLFNLAMNARSEMIRGASTSQAAGVI